MLLQLPAVPLGFLSRRAITLSERGESPAGVFSAIPLQHRSGCGERHRHARLAAAPAAAQSCSLQEGRKEQYVFDEEATCPVLTAQVIVLLLLVVCQDAS